ncbi:hypothetical protein [Streptomyces californicus]|uniref:hypothetical protein n=1 Tax=Streptomyces californicus TaxID=67351 RepID=UPI00368FFEF1
MPLFELVDAPFGRMALLVRLGVEGGRAASGAAVPQVVADLVPGRKKVDAKRFPASR